MYLSKSNFEDWLKESPIDAENIPYNDYNTDGYTDYYQKENDIDINAGIYNQNILDQVQYAKLYSPEDMTEDLQMYDMTIENYSNGKKVFLDPKSKHYHLNVLFKKLINHCSNDFYSVTYKKSPNEIDNVNNFDKTLKNDFYKFCYENSN